MAGEDRLIVEIQPDIIARLSKTKPLAALCELIWNGLDADADRVSVDLEYDDLGGLRSITVTDNGDGLPRADALVEFGKYGGSWKKPGGVTKRRRRALHGFEGRGRFNALALGRVADWNVTYEAAPGDRRAYTINMLADNNRQAIVSEEKATSSDPGVRVVITEPLRQFQVFEQERAEPALVEVFALYLLDYREVTIALGGQSLDAAAAIFDRTTELLPPIETEDGSFPAELEIVEWRSMANRALHLCTEHGIPLMPVVTRFHVSQAFQFSAYMKSSLISRLHEARALDFAVSAELSDAIDNARSVIRDLSRKRAAEKARSVVERWKNEKIYPFEGDSASPVEEMERQVFDMVAVTASEHIADFDTSGSKNRALHLRLLRAAIEKSPSELQMILTEVLKLPSKQRTELAELLQESSLSSIIGASKIVADRLKTVQGLEAIVFDPDMKRRLKERTQLHQILNDNAWLFGNEYSLSVTDRGLTEVLRQHQAMLGGDVVIDEPVRHISQKTGIVDLMFSRAIKSHRPNETEHLVVELKAPKVVLSAKDAQQIEGYAFSVAQDERFRDATTRWHFWLVSNDMDDHVKIKTRQTHLPRGMVHQSAEPSISIWVRTWAQIFDENKARLKFFQEHLNYEVDQGDALKFVSEKYRHFLEGVVSDVEATNRDDVGDSAN